MAAMEEDAPDMGGFDLEAYIANYTGHTRVERLIFIADRSRGKPLELEALRMAHDELRKTDNALKYLEVCHKIDGRLGPAYTLDKSFVEASDRRAAQRQERLEADLHTHKANLIKESIRMGHNDLGDFSYERGDLQTAFKCYARTRDYCTTSKHIIAMCLHVIRVSVELGNYLHVSNYVTKAEQTPDIQADGVVMAKLRAASGLTLLAGKKYKAAARKLCEVGPELGTTYSDVLAPADIATYGGLCALATLERPELRTRIIANIGFKEFLELAPEVRELIQDFYHSRYASCLRHLTALRPALALDLHLADHIGALYTAIRRRALCQYTAPFTAVDLNTMATAFSTPVGELERELASLIMDGAIMARIDSGTKVLYARHADVRASTYQRVMTAGEAYLRDSRALLLRANLVQHDFMQKSKKSERDERGRGGGGGHHGGGVMERLADFGALAYGGLGRILS